MGNLKANIALAVGYWLLYCALAEGGSFALNPWSALKGSTTTPESKTPAHAEPNVLPGGFGGTTGKAKVAA